jgi:hypothetical protein
MAAAPLRRTPTRWQATLVALALVALVAAAGGGATAKARFDAKNADKVDGKDAVSARAGVGKRKGKLVATDPKTGKLPRNIVAISPVLAIAPQGVWSDGSATVGRDGVAFPPTGSGEMRFGFVVPPEHKPGTGLDVDVVYREDSAGACSWYASTSGLEGPDSPTGSDIHNGGWQFPGSASGYDGAVSVPAGDGSVHTTTFHWPFQDDPGMFIQLAVDRAGDNVADTCGYVSVYGIQVRY